MNKYLFHFLFGLLFLAIKLDGSFSDMSPFLSKLLFLEQGLDDKNFKSQKKEYYQRLEMDLLEDFKNNFDFKIYQNLNKKRKETSLLDCEESIYHLCMPFCQRKEEISSYFARLRYANTIILA